MPSPGTLLAGAPARRARRMCLWPERGPAAGRAAELCPWEASHRRAPRSARRTHACATQRCRAGCLVWLQLWRAPMLEPLPALQGAAVLQQAPARQLACPACTHTCSSAEGSASAQFRASRLALRLRMSCRCTSAALAHLSGRFFSLHAKGACQLPAASEAALGSDAWAAAASAHRLASSLCTA